MSSNPLKKKVAPKEVVVKPKKILNTSVVKSLLDYDGVVGEGIIRWCERWLVQLVRERSYPPQIVGLDALGTLTQFLTPSDAMEVLTKIRMEFRKEHSILFQKEDFGFLLKAFADEGIPQSSLVRLPPLDVKLRHILGL